MSDRRRCTIVSCCFSKKPITGGVRLYGLPKDAHTRSEWLHWVKLQNGPDCGQKNACFICSNHFAADDKLSRKLRKGAVPTIAANDASQSNNGTTDMQSSSEFQNMHPNLPLINEPGEIHPPSAKDASQSNNGTTDMQSSSEFQNMHPNLPLINEPGEIHPPSAKDASQSNNGTIDMQSSSESQNMCPVLPLINDPIEYSSIVEIDPVLTFNEPSELTEYSSIVEIDMSETNFYSSEIKDNATNDVLLDQSKVWCAPDIIEVQNDDTYYLQILFDESNVELNNNFVADYNCDSTKIIVEEVNSNLIADYNCDPTNIKVEDAINVVEIPEELSRHHEATTTSEDENPIVEIPQVRNRNHKPTTTRKCFAYNCDNPNKKTVHSFPAIIINGQISDENLQRCKTWVRNCGNIELLDLVSSKLHGRYGLCSDHFNDAQYYNPQTRKRLLPDAIPTENFDDPLCEADMNQFPRLSDSEILSGLSVSTTAEHDENSNTVDADEPENSNNSDEDQSKPDNNQRKFEDVVNTLEWRTCNNCKEKFFTKKSSKKNCAHSRPICHTLSSANGLDPGEVPPELQDLTSIEEQLISIVHPVVQVWKVKGHQYSYKGNVINFPQDVKTFAAKLPHNINELTSIIKVRTSKDATDFKDFHVRADVVRKALNWLQRNNPFYFDIQISEENLNLLPEDGNAYELIQGIELEQQSEDDDNSDDHELITETNVPVVSVPGEQEQISNVIDWPTIGKNPVDELKHSEGYVVKAFPTLFPYGVADLGFARRKKISDTTYFQHMMRYHDERFAKHNRFRFFALNSLMRWSALTDGNIFIKRHPEFKNMSVKDLKEKVESDPLLLRKIMFQGSNIRGTKAYWHARGRELEAMVQQIGLPTLFLTLSAADMHWPELYKLLAPDENAETMTEYRRRELIQENPLIVDEFFLTRAEVFLQEVLAPKYKVKDFWFRIEYQHRGSPHLHGLLWLENAPDVSNLSNATEEEKEAIVNYFDKLISTMHPNVNEPPATIHPCRVQLSEVKDFKKDLAQLLNRVQRHTVCTPGYCLKKGNPPSCRFNFPAEMCEHSKLDFTDKNNIKLLTARNDNRLNKFNPYIIRTWRGNIDVSPVLSQKALINYLAKYISKSETRSKTVIDLMKSIISNSDQDKPARHALQRMFIKTCSERDYSAQETCHILMGLKLFSRGARNFVSLNFNDSSQWQQIRKNGQAKTLSILDQYKQRSEDKEMICLWDMAKYHKVSNRQKFNIIMVYPTIKLKTTSQENESFYRQQCLLFVPWREEATLQQDKSWEEVYTDNLPLISKNQETLLHLSGEPDVDDAVECEPETLPQEQWMAISSMRSNQHTSHVELGFRQVDLGKDWHAALSQYESVGGIPYLQSFIANAKQNSTSSSTTNQKFQFDLSPEQSKVVELVELQILKLQNRMPAKFTNKNIPKKVIVQGKAGTGKSVIVSEIVRLVETQLGQGTIMVLGPTGVSAVNVSGSTIHSKLKIGARNKHSDIDEFVPLKGQAAHDFAQAFENVKFVICDEFSMIGCSLLNKIDQRLRQATGKNEDFGGLNIYFFGDIKQLSPVADSAAYSTTQKSMQTLRGKQLYDNMDAAFILTKIHRQNNAEFLQVLNNISQGKVTRKDYDLLSTRFISALSCAELKEFRNALHLYPELDQVHSFNKDCLESLMNHQTKEPVPVARVQAKHNCSAAKQGTISNAEGLEPTLYLAEGAKIMLRSNVWTEKGLVNGAMGEIEEIIYSADAHPSYDPPSVLICKFPSYKGPYLDPVKKTVPISPHTRSWLNADQVNCSREQFPITVAYATTIHKSQGLTLLKAFVDLGKREMSPGLSYVALSRVKSLEGLVLQPFSFERLKNLSNSIAIRNRLAWEQLLEEKLFSL